MRKQLWFVTLIMIAGVVLWGCEEEGSSTKGSSASPADSDDPSSTDEGGKDDKKDDVKTENIPPAPAVPVCMKSCDTVDDCKEFRSDPLHMKANYICTSGACVYLGCTSDANCAEAYPAAKYVCNSKGECVDGCDSAADCMIFDAMPDGDDSHDENNWACESGKCKYLGCLSTDECVVEFGKQSICWDSNGDGVNDCSNKCSSDTQSVAACVDDQENSARDEDNYECVADRCMYNGCVDGECGDDMVCIKLKSN